MKLKSHIYICYISSKVTDIFKITIKEYAVLVISYVHEQMTINK